MNIKLTIEISEELSRKVEERATAQGLSVGEVIKQKLEEYAENLVAQTETGARFLKISEVDPTYRLTPAEVKASLQSLTRMDKIAEEIGRKSAGQPVDAVELVREGRREF
jgi:predicted transcriptional regulator